MPPDWKAEIRARITTLALAAGREAEIVEELAQHLEDRVADLQGHGVPPDDAYRTARAELSDPGVLAEFLRQAERPMVAEPIALGAEPIALGAEPIALGAEPARRRRRPLGGLWRDVRYGARSFRRSPGFTAIVVATLALGIGANTTIFSAVYALLVRPMPYPHAERLAVVGWQTSAPDVTSGFSAFWSSPRLETLERTNRVFSGVAGFAQRYATLTGGAQAERVGLELVTGDYFRTFGVRAALGRPLETSDDREGAAPVVLISHALWLRRFGGDSAVIGRALQLKGHPFTVVGVTAAGFGGQSGQVDLWLPHVAAGTLFSRLMLDSPDIAWMEVVARLAPGVGVPAAEEALRALRLAIVAGASPEQLRLMEAPRLVPLAEYKRDPAISRSFLVLFAAVAFVLLVTCLNVAGLLVTRAIRRRREVALRVAIGATPAGIVRQLVVEHVLLALGGGLGAALLSVWGVRLLATTGRAIAGRQFGTTSSQLFDPSVIRLDAGVLAFNFLLALVAAVLFGFGPAWIAARSDVSAVLKEGGGGRTVTGGRSHARRWLAATEMALAIVLVVGAGLMTRSLVDLRAIRLGYDANGVTSFTIPPSDRPAIESELLRRLGTLPGVESVGAATGPPLGGYVNTTPVTVESSGGAPVRVPDVGVHYADGAFFRTLRVPIVQGRAFTDADGPDAPRVVIVNQAAARRLWPGANPIGQRIHLEANWPRGAWAEVVGVAGDVQYRGVEDVVESDVYLPWRQGGFIATFFVRSTLPPASLVPSIRREVAAVDPDLPVTNIRPLAALGAEATARTRYASLLLVIFAGIATLVAAIGVYGVVAHLVSDRRRELGIRIALGAGRRSVVRLVLREGLRMSLWGAATGIVLAFGTTRVLRSSLYLVSPTDPVTFVLAAALLSAIGLLAAWIPARRATKVDPMTALRSE